MNYDSLVVFDIDGTLLRTECVTVPAVQRAFAAYGLYEPEAEAICAFFGKPVEEYEAWLAAQCPPDAAAEIVAATNALELRLIREEGRLYPGARETLVTLHHNGFQLAVCSNGPEPYVNEFLDAHGLADLFRSVYARGTRYTDKTEMIGLMVTAMRPDRFAVIGDRKDDIEAAHSCGGCAIAATYGFGNAEEWQHADAHIAAITEAPEALEKVFNAKG